MKMKSTFLLLQMKMKMMGTLPMIQRRGKERQIKGKEGWRNSSQMIQKGECLVN
jgi:hypothetical protein